MEKKEYKIELHCHTDESSCCGRVPAAELVELYKAKGYDGLVITDHLSSVIYDAEGVKDSKDAAEYFLKGYRLAKAQGDICSVRVYLAAEIRFPGSPNDYLVYGLTEDMILDNIDMFKTTLAEFKKYAEANGLYIIQAHPYRHPCTPAPAEYLDGMEIYNGHKGHDSHNDLAKAYAEASGLWPTAGSDCHYYHAVGTAAVIFDTLPDNTSQIAQLLSEGLGRLESYEAEE